MGVKLTYLGRETIPIKNGSYYNLGFKDLYKNNKGLYSSDFRGHGWLEKLLKIVSCSDQDLERQNETSTEIFSAAQTVEITVQGDEHKMLLVYKCIF